MPIKALILLSLSLVITACGGGGSNNNSGNPTPTPTNTPVPEGDIDLLSFEPSDGLIRLYGSSGRGHLGTPVTGGYDVNGDGNQDFALASMLASPLGRDIAGEVFLALGTGSIDYTLDSALDNANVLSIIGEGDVEVTGSEIWMGDITGDGLGELIIARQNYTPPNPTRIGAGALSIIIGSPELTNLAAANEPLDLSQAPPSGLNIVTIVGDNALDRLGIWMRVGDITGDGIDDLAVAADQHDQQGANSGAVYVIRGGSHLNDTVTIDLNDIDNAFSQHVAKVVPPANSGNYHFGGTINVADLDSNGTAELIVAATINRAGASIDPSGGSGSAQGSGGFPNGRLYIIWDDNFPETWVQDFTITTDNSALGGITDIQGATTASFNNDHFGEEIIGGLDYNGDGNADLFIGDITGDTFEFSAAGLGFVFFNAAQLKDASFAMNNRPSNLEVTTIFGPETGAISSDTALHGDFDNDGIADLAVASPHAAPFGRTSAGALHVLWGQSDWPSTINLAPDSQPTIDMFNITNIYGALPTRGTDTGDTLAYSAANGDLDNDGLTDVIVNEMVGNGASPNTIDVGNLIIISGAALAETK